jgi:hypothetical protein
MVILCKEFIMQSMFSSLDLKAIEFCGKNGIDIADAMREHMISSITAQRAADERYRNFQKFLKVLDELKAELIVPENGTLTTSWWVVPGGLNQHDSCVGIHSPSCGGKAPRLCFKYIEHNDPAYPTSGIVREGELTEAQAAKFNAAIALI